MRRIAVGAEAVIALLLAPVSASAADYAPVPAPVYAPPPPLVPMQVVPLWSGFYVGGNLGGGWAHSPSSFSVGGPVFASARNYASGAIGGAQIGYNWQYGAFVFGGESDIQFANGEGSLSAFCPASRCGVTVAARVDQKMNWFGTSRGRLGYAQDSWLVYFTGGYVYAAFQTDASALAGGVTAHADEGGNRSGWTVGGGVEIAFTREWSVKAEYLYADLGDRITAWTVPAVPRFSHDDSLNMNIVRVGVNYRFY